MAQSRRRSTRSDSFNARLTSFDSYVGVTIDAAKWALENATDEQQDKNESISRLEAELKDCSKEQQAEIEHPGLVAFDCGHGGC